MKKINDASPLDGAINSIQGELKKVNLELVGDPVFERQGNFTLAVINARKLRGKKLIQAYGISKRNNLDKKNPVIGRRTALSRAVQSLIKNTKTE